MRLTIRESNGPNQLGLCTRQGNSFGRSPYHEKSWKKQDYTCDCGTWIPDFCRSWTNRTACDKFWYCSAWKDGVCDARPPYPDHNCSDWGGAPYRTVGTAAAADL